MTDAVGACLAVGGVPMPWVLVRGMKSTAAAVMGIPVDLGIAYTLDLISIAEQVACDSPTAWLAGLCNGPLLVPVSPLLSGCHVTH